VLEAKRCRFGCYSCARAILCNTVTLLVTSASLLAHDVECFTCRALFR